MKGFQKLTILLAFFASLLTSCLKNEGSSYSGFTNISVSALAYANTAQGSVSFVAYGPWRIDVTEGDSWLTPSASKGSSMTYNIVPLKFGMNGTRAVRSAVVRLADTDNSEVNSSFVLTQYGTRGDGSWGDAPLVNSIMGDDGSEINITYDDLCRPTAVSLEKNDAVIRKLTLVWGDSILTVNGELTASFDNGYQPSKIVSTTDTIGLFSQSVAHSYLLSVSTAFNFEEHQDNSGEYIVQALLMNNQSTNTSSTYDTEYSVDSLRYLHHRSDDTEMRVFMSIVYNTEAVSNRCQSVDANQLLLGVEECNPYLLLGLFRSARSASLFSEAHTSEGNYVMEAALNADKSINTLAVTDRGGNKITYTFCYSNNRPWK